jgi:hypothetical protein
MTNQEKIIYDILCSDEQPPEGQHWEGFVTNKIVEALAQPEPKAVAWMWDVYNGAGFTSRGIDFYPTNIPFAKHTPLYTAPPKREWVGLTDEDREWCDEHSYGNTSGAKQKAYGRAIEAKLKEKNNAT